MRLILKVRNWPEHVDENSQLLDRLKFLMKKVMDDILLILAASIHTTKPFMYRISWRLQKQIELHRKMISDGARLRMKMSQMDTL